MKLYIVGGMLRDLLLGRRPRDPDHAFAGSDEEFVQTYPDARKINASFSVFEAQHKEYARLRGTCIEEDLFARDFTINALAMDEKGMLFSHPRAFSDLKNGVIRACGPDSLSIDPGRVFRAARFAAEFPAFSVDSALFEQLEAIGKTAALSCLPAERVAKEFLKALAAPCPGRFFQILHKGRCLLPWFREFDAAARLPAGPWPWHTGTTLEHIMETMNAAVRYASRADRQLAAYMASVHDIGKILSDPARLPAHHGHDRKGEMLAEALAIRLKLPKKFKITGKIAARWHMTASNYATLRPGTKVELLVRLHQHNILRPFFAMLCADASRPGREAPDFSAQAAQDLECILGIHLPTHLQNQGKQSAAWLKSLRGQALAQKYAMPSPR